MADDDFTDDEIAEFSAIGDDDKKKLARFTKWQESEKAKSGDPTVRGNPRSRVSSLTVEDLEEIVSRPKIRPILRNLLDAADLEASNGNNPNNPNRKKPGDGKKASLFSVI